MSDLREEIESAHNSESSKNEYKLNIAMTISTLKERVVELVMCENKRRSRRILRQIKNALKKSVVSILPNRSFPRKRKHSALKFHNNSKLI